MNFGENLNRIINEFQLTAKQIADKYTEQTGLSIDQRSIRRYALSESTPREDIQRKILNAAIALTPLSSKETPLVDFVTIHLNKSQSIQQNPKDDFPNSSSENTSPKSSDSTSKENKSSFASCSSVFSEFLINYGYEPSYIPSGFLEVPQNYARQIIEGMFTKQYASKNHYNYLGRNLDSFMLFDPFEIQMAKNFQRLSLPDRADIIRLLSSESMPLQFMVKPSTNLTKYKACINLIKESESRPSEWDYGEDTGDDSLFLDSLDINESDYEDMARVAELSYDLVSLSPSEWQFLMFLQIMEANDRGINHCNTAFSPNNIVGDKVAMLIFFMNKKLEAIK